MAVGTWFDPGILYRVGVDTFALGGTLYDLPFQLVVNCAK